MSKIYLPETDTPFLFTSRDEARTRLKLFQVFGERRSGTNHVERVFQANTRLQSTRQYGWKHGFPYVPVLPRCVLFIVIVRHPVQWCASLFKEPFEAADHLRELDFSAFLRTEWRSQYRPIKQQWSKSGYADHPMREDTVGRYGQGEDLQLDVNPLTGQRFRNILEMRNVKFQGHMSLINRGLNCAILRHEDLCEDEEATFSRVAAAFNLHKPENYKKAPHVKVEMHDEIRRQRIEKISSEDLEFIQAGLHTETEQRLGYL